MQNNTLYLQRLRQLLQMEYEAEKEEFRVQTEKMSLQRKIHRGICWYPIQTGKSYYNSLNQLVVEIINKGNENEDIEHLFEYGKPVQFLSIEAEQTSSRHHYHSFSSSVSYVDGSRMVVTLPSSQALIDIQNTENLGVQL